MKGFAVWAAMACLPFAAAGKAGEVTALAGGTVIDGTGAAPMADAVVLIEGERIAAVGPRARVAIPPGARIIDASGKWIMPGLIDAHVHFFQSGGLYTRPDIIDLRDARPYPEEQARIRARLAQTFARYLASGVTSVVDMGGPMENFRIRDLARRTALAPRVAVAGPLISNHMPQELRSEDPPIIVVESTAAALRVLRRELAHQPDLVKLWLIRTPGRRLVAEEAWVRAVIDASHAAGVRVAVHATQLAMARAAVNAGADILAHSVDDRLMEDAFVRLLRQRGIGYITTFVVHEGYREVLGGEVSLSEIEQRVGDADVIATFDDLARLRPGYRLAWTLTAAPGSVMFGNLKRAASAGVGIAAGTDAGNIGTLHGPALHRELELMAQAGLSPMQILIAATSGGARVMGRGHELGTIEKDRLADLVILDADPLLDIRNTRRIYRVVKGGEVLDPQEIIAGLAHRNQ